MEYFDALTALFESEDADMFKPKPKKHVVTPNDRLIDSFSEITLFVREHGLTPSANADDMHEAVLGTGLNAIRLDKHKVELLEEYDEYGLLELEKAPQSLEELFADDKGLFGYDSSIFDDGPGKVISNSPRSADSRAVRRRVDNFNNTYKQEFIDQQTALGTGKRKLTPFYSIDQLQLENYYVYDGMMCFISGVEKSERKAGGYSQQRIHVIYENGTWSDMYRRSLAQRLYEGGSMVVDSNYTTPVHEDEAVGRIYILKSQSIDPQILTIKNLYKIGVTKGTVENRIRNALTDPTYLMAPVEVIEDYRLTGEYNPQKVEDLIHQIFSHAKVDLQIIAPDGKLYVPQEWYSVPLGAILEAVELTVSREIVNYHYDSATQCIVEN